MRGPKANNYAKQAYYTFKAGLEGEKQSAYFIDFDYGDSSKNWAVIHDLRLEHGGRVAQIDHLLISRFLEIYALETKHFASGVKITEEGEFLRWDDFKKTYFPMECPLEQNRRHLSVLVDVVKTLNLPERLGVRLQPTLHSYVLVANKAKVMRPKTFDASSVIKADQLKQRIDKDSDEISTLGIFGKVSKIVSAETVRDLAQQLAAKHRPLSYGAAPPPTPAPRVAEPAPAPYAVTPLATLPGPKCKACGKEKGEILHGQYGYYFKCAACAANTAIRFTCQPGHRPWLRKAGTVFFRDCPQCGSSEPFHANAAVK